MFERTLFYKTIASPIGQLRLISGDKGLCAILFKDGQNTRLSFEGTLEKDDGHVILVKAEKQLNEYFAKKRKAFDVKLDLRGTIFQQMAWKQLQQIPYGTTISYSEQAKRVGDIKKARAVGMANGRNPIPIIVPCHRVIGESGKLTGYAGGLDIKQYLLAHENVAVAAA